MAYLQMVRHRFWDNDGSLLSGGKVYIYEPGTTTPKNSYTDYTQATPNAHPVILDSKGEADIWINGAFKIDVKNSADAQVTGYPVDNIRSLLNYTSLAIGDTGTEGSGINIGGVVYESTFKVSDIDGSNYAQTILHRHSTTLEPLIVGARSNSNTSSHADVTNNQGLMSIFGVGFAGSNYKIFGYSSFGVDSTGTVSNTSAPGSWSLYITPDGSTTPVRVLKVGNDGSINGAKLAHKNKIINGNFQIAQAGTSFVSPASGAYDLDGWLNTNTSAAIFTVTQATGSSAEKLARIVTITTADASVAAGDLLIDQTRIEGYDIVDLVGQTFTVSFWAKFPVTGIHCVSLVNAANDRSYVHEINVSAANTWTQYSFTVTGGLPTAGTWAYTNANALKLSIAHMAGSTYQTTADAWNTGNFYATANQVNDCATNSNVWGLQDVRIDLGTQIGSDWPSYQENLARCERYYRLIRRGVAGTVYDATRISWAFIYTPMRAIPTITLENTTFQVLIAGSAISAVAAAITDTAISNGDAYLLTSGFTGLTAGQGAVVRNGATASFISLSSRL